VFLTNIGEGPTWPGHDLQQLGHGSASGCSSSAAASCLGETGMDCLGFLTYKNLLFNFTFISPLFKAKQNYVSRLNISASCLSIFLK